MTEQFSNCIPTSLSATITATQTTISVADASTYPKLGNFRIAAQMFDASGLNPISTREIMIVTAVAGNTFTVQRGQEGTTALAYPSGTRIVHIITAAVMTALAAGGGGGSGLTVTAVSNGSPYTATATPAIYTIYNTSGSAYTFNLPASPAINQQVVIVDAGLTAGAHAITVQGNGNNIIAYGQSAASSFGIASNGGSLSLAWDGTNWVQYA